MMHRRMARVERFAPILNVLQYLEPKMRVSIVRSGSPEFIKCLIEVALNFLRGNLKMDQATISKLRRHKRKLRNFSYQRGRAGIKKARDQLTQKGGLLPLLIPLLAALGGAGAAAGVASAVIPSIAKKAARSATNSALDTVEERAKKAINKISI